ncbi:hypothetical protein PENTCL1PPCAC_27131 [Pristionchus entomophagus]|uniref:Uncharacterized protein n=1 Tax=Pristionchus entomophagus TaxID=358040 RepID=A0AAV5UDK3_9BILA|nr:hypothetical protein PENTCL1PPCAC_27131 [Pristionchus entomophagus]
MSSQCSGRKRRRCPDHLRGNFTSFFWDAHADLVREMMSRDLSFSSNGSFYDYSFSDGEEDQRYCNVKNPSHSLGTGGDSGVASSCSVTSSNSHSSPLYSHIKSTTRGIRRSQSSSTISEVNERQRERRGERRWDRRGKSIETARPPQRNTYASASFHHSRVSAAPSTEGRYNVKKRKIYEECNMSVRTESNVSTRPCCWECFEAKVERERVSAGLPARTAYLPEPVSENHYENISLYSSDGRVNRSLRCQMETPLGPAIPPPHPRRTTDQREESTQSDTYARLCSIEFSKLHVAESIFSDERLASLQRKIERLLLVKSDIDLSEKSLNEAQFAKAANQVVYRIERRLRAIEAYSQPQFKKITADLISLLASAEKKQKSKMDTFKRGFARAVKVIF